MTDRPTTWRYIMSRERLPDGEEWYSVRELYEGPKGALSWSKDPVTPKGNSWEECCQDVVRFGNAVWKRTVLDLTLDPPAIVTIPVPR